MEEFRFKNIGGYEFQKKEAQKISAFFQDYQHYKSKGARIPKGIIFYGPPGTGKTLFANAIINESKVKSFCLTSDKFYSEKSVDTAIHNVFEEAKKEAPSIILIDEIDRIVNCSMSIRNPQTDSQRSALRCLLTEIDKIKNNDVLVITTANVPIDCVPPSLVRNGRIEKHICIDVPSLNERVEILNLFLKDKELLEDISSKEIATYTSNFTGASIECLINDVLINCISENKKATFFDFIEPIEAIKSSGIKRKQNKNINSTIYHEIGHFVTNYVLNDEIGMLSIIPFGETDGRFSRLRDDDEIKNLTKAKDNCVVGIAGLVATKMFLKEPYFGASNDIETITDIYFNCLKNGMLSNSETAYYLLYGEKNDQFPDSYLQPFYKEFLDECENRAKRIINANREIVNCLFNFLKEKGTLFPDEIKDLIKDIKVVKEKDCPYL